MMDQWLHRSYHTHGRYAAIHVNTMSLLIICNSSSPANINIHFLTQYNKPKSNSLLHSFLLSECFDEANRYIATKPTCNNIFPQKYDDNCTSI